MPIRDSHILKRFFHLGSAFGFREALNAVFFILLARRSAAAYGGFVLALGFSQILLFVAEYGLNQRLVTELARDPARRSESVGRMNALKLLIVGLAALALGALTAWQRYPPGLLALIWIFAGAAALDAVSGSFFTACRVEGRQAAEGRIRQAAALAAYGYGIVALALGAPAPAVAAFRPIEGALCLAAVARASRLDLRIAFAWPGLGPAGAALQGSLAFIAMALATSVYNRSNLFFLQRAAGPEAVAQYGAAWQIADGLSGLVSSLLLANVLFPQFAALSRSDTPALRATARLWAFRLLVAGALGSALLALGAERLVPLLFGDAYRPAVPVLRILAATVAIGMLHNLCGYLMISLGRERLLLLFHVIGLAVNLALCAAAMSNFTPEAAARVLLLTKAAVAALTLGYCQHRLQLFFTVPGLSQPAK